MKIYYKGSKGLKEVNFYGMNEGKFMVGLKENATISVTRDALNFPDNISNKDAIELLQNGVTLTHKYFTDNEYIKMKLGIIYDENDYELGCWNEFMSERKIFDNGWSVYYG